MYLDIFRTPTHFSLKNIALYDGYREIMNRFLQTNRRNMPESTKGCTKMHPFVVLAYRHMRKDYEKLFTHLKPQEPSVGLLSKIMARIHQEEQLLSIKRRLILFSTAVMVSAGAFIPIISAFQTEFAQSGMYQFFSLIFTNSGLAMAYWQDFGLAILESLPAVSAIALLATTLIFLWSLKHLTEALVVVFSQPQLINNQ